MATVLRDWSYRYPWLYEAISRSAALAVGGYQRFHELPMVGLTLPPQAVILDLCCGSGAATRMLVERGRVTGLDASPRSLAAAQQRVPTATYVEAFAENLPFPDHSFDLVYTSVALHEMTPDQRRAILGEVGRVLKPGGWFTLIDFHAPARPVPWLPLALFLWLFETQTAWGWLAADLDQELGDAGLVLGHRHLYAGDLLQVVQAQRPAGVGD
ncbi:MAG: class I SAM-dependent methyltransferase [Gloeomargaritaceae cyanobacterium C42_A2020_066]|nr:class I SAM-dependent methyltransferase [Gloeomargaritaceae cyanobacterium C42_A2020_066]